MRNWQEDWELCEKATPGPWEAVARTIEFVEEHDAVIGHIKITLPCEKISMPIMDNNAQFVAEARKALPYWLNAYRELEAKAAAMREKLELVQFPGFIGCTLPDDYKFTVKISAGEFRAISDGLSSTAGKALLDRLRKAEAVVEAAKPVYAMAVNIGDFRNGNTCQGVDEGQEMANRQLDKLKQALDDLEGQC